MKGTAFQMWGTDKQKVAIAQKDREMGNCWGQQEVFRTKSRICVQESKEQDYGRAEGAD